MNCTFECPICMQGPKRDMVWQMVEECGHVFCSACISTHLNRNKWCPLCKASVHHCMKPEDALIKVYLPLKYGDDHEGRNAQSPEDAKDLANLPETQVTDRPELAQTSGKKRKTYYCFMQEIEQRNKTIREVEKELSTCQRRLRDCKARHSMERAKIEVELEHKTRLVDKRQKQIMQTAKQLQEGKTKYQELQARFTELKTMVQVEGLFNNADLDLRSINHTLRGQDEGHTINLLTKALALRNEQYNKLSQKKDDLEKGDNEKIEGLEMNNKKLREKLRRQSESIKKMKEVQDRNVNRDGDGRVLKHHQQESKPVLDGPKPKQNKKDSTGTGTASLIMSRSSTLASSSPSHRPPSFIKGQPKQSLQRSSQPCLISEGHDGFGGKRKVLHSVTNMQKEESRLSFGIGAQGSTAKRAKPYQPLSGKRKGISLSGAKARLGVVDLTRHDNLNMEHYFDRA